MSEKKNRIVYIRLTEETFNAIKAKAEVEDRSVSSLIRVIVDNHVSKVLVKEAKKK
jgi:hypothetical protein